jgi:hypothetical protein
MTPVTSTEPEQMMPQPEEAETAEPTVRRAVDDELLSLLHSLQSSHGNPPPISGASNSSAPSLAPAPTVQWQSAPPVQKTIQRALTDDSPISQNAQAAESDQQAEVNVDRLARDVYKMLQNRLRIERERRDRL